jgi:hypothetical protein
MNSFTFDPFGAIPKVMGKGGKGGGGGPRGTTLHFKLQQVKGAWRWDIIHNITVQKGAKEFLAETDYPLIVCF